jgi:hypothetical protein
LAHIHKAPVGQPGGVVFDLGTGNPKTGTWMLDHADAADLLADRLYVNIHSSAHGGGEIRGQIYQIQKIYLPLIMR